MLNRATHFLFLAGALLSGTASATVPTAVPALDSWGLLGLAVLAGLAGVIAIRMKRK
ncbi:MAG: IPTL-CTERM sorting domain-containing protein [Chromatiales bacterium]|nr:IPTL-CTERM sorting domain-containing protein [Chromatiales bacterium]